MPPRSRRGKVPATASTPLVIDHELYPHIFDLILSSTPRSALLHLRQTSTSVCAAVDRLLACHLIIEIPNHCQEPLAQGAPVLLYTPEGRLPCYKSFWSNPAPFFLWYTPDGLGVVSTTSRPHARIAAALRGTSVVDLVHVDAYTATFLLPLLPALRTVRDGSTWCSDLAIPAHTMVTFHTLFGRRGTYIGPAVPLPGTRKLVIHIHTSLESWRCMLRAPDYLPPTTTELVVIFHQSDTRRSKLRRSQHRPPAPGVLCMLAQHMSQVTWLGVARRYTFVDAHKVDPAAFGFPERTLERGEVETRLRAALRRPEPNIRIPLYPEGMYDFERPRPDTVRFLDLEEYLASDGAHDEMRPQTTSRHMAREEAAWIVTREDE